MTAQGATFSNEVAIAGTTDELIYQSERNTGSDTATTEFSYAIPVPANGTYEVTLHFAEIFFGTPTTPAPDVGTRVFDVLLQDQLVLPAYDLYVAAGNATTTALTETFTVEVTDATIVVRVTNIANRGKLSAIEIHGVKGAELPDPCNGTGDGNGNESGDGNGDGGGDGNGTSNGTGNGTGNGGATMNGDGAAA